MQAITKAAQKLSRANSTSWIKEDINRLQLFPQKIVSSMVNPDLPKTVAEKDREKEVQEFQVLKLSKIFTFRFINIISYKC